MRGSGGHLIILITSPRPFLGAATNTLTGGHPMTKYLHTMIRVSSLENTIAFFEVLGLREIRRRPDEKGRYTNVFLAAPGDEAAAVELTYNWDPEPYTGGRNFGHLAYAVDNIYDTCGAFIARRVTAAWPLSARRTASPSSYCRPAKRCRLPNPGPAWPIPVHGRPRRLWRGCPITRAEAQAMIAEIKGARLLQGFRGRPAADRFGTHDRRSALAAGTALDG